MPAAKYDPLECKQDQTGDCAEGEALGSQFEGERTIGGEEGDLRVSRGASFVTMGSVEALHGEERHRSPFEMDFLLSNYIGFGWFQYKVIFAAGMLLTVDAMEMMLLSFLGPSVRCEFGITSEEEAFLTTTVFLGAMIGAYTCGTLADEFGRRITLKFVSFFTLLLAVVSAFAPNYVGLLVIRGLMGIALGGGSVSFSYAIEMMPLEYRGKWGILLFLFWTLGTFICALFAWTIYATQKTEGAWRTLLLVSSAPIVLAAIVFICNLVPRSPRYLVTANREAEAYNVLRKAAKQNGKELPEEGALKPVTKSKQQNARGTFHTLRALFNRQFRFLTVLLWFIWFTNGFIYYGIVLMTTSLAVAREREESSEGRDLFCDPVTNSPFSDEGPFVSVLIDTLAEAPGIILAVFIVDSLGRKLSQALCFGLTALALLAMLFLTTETSDTAFLFIARGSVEAAFVVTYVYTPEAYPTAIRTTAFGISNAFSRIGAMACPFVGQDLVERGNRFTALLIFVIFSALATVASVFLPVETSGRKLSDTVQDDDEIDDGSSDSEGLADPIGGNGVEMVPS